MLGNGVLVGYFPSKRGLKKGDPLSPYLFIILVEALGRAFSKAFIDKIFEGIKVALSLDPIIFEQLLDDTIISSRSSLPQA